MSIFNGLENQQNLKVDEYIKIANHGAIFNNRTAVLIGMDGTMDWACFPDFDSKTVFDSILDSKKGGYFSVKPLCDNVTMNQYYEEFTNILITEFYNKNKLIMRITDFLPISEYSKANYPEIHRFIEALEDIQIKIEFKPNFNFGREIPTIEHKKFGYIFHGTENNVGISSNFKFIKTDNMIYNDKIPLNKGVFEWIVISSDISHLNDIKEYKSYERLEETRDYWKKWTNNINYHGIYHKYVLRSALILKGLFYEPTGMMVAAPTSSLPESIGGERNWDYRFTWIRDTAYVIEAFSMIGLKNEATQFLYDLMEKIHKDKEIKTIYEINSKNSLEEQILDYSGYMNSSPVRIGNKASSQLQVDQYGSIINMIYHFNLIGGMITVHFWDFIEEVLEKLESVWKLPDSSIWEIRTEPRHYVYSKLTSWLAFHRAISMGKSLGYSAPYKKWKKIENEIKNDILEKGFNKDVNSFVQYYGADCVDASLLSIPIMEFLPIDDKRLIGTIDKIEHDLMTDDYLFKRYNNYDGFTGEDNAFLMLSFWYIEDLIAMNRVSKAKNVLESILTKSNHLMLFSEEIDLKTKDMIGNFPQALTHLGILKTIVKLNLALKNNTMGKYISKR